MVNPAFSESQLKNLRRQNRHLASTHRRKLVFLQASRNPAHGSGRPFFVRDVPVPASFCPAPVPSPLRLPFPQLRPFCRPCLCCLRLPASPAHRTELGFVLCALPFRIPARHPGNGPARHLSARPLSLRPSPLRLPFPQLRPFRRPLRFCPRLPASPARRTKFGSVLCVLPFRIPTRHPGNGPVPASFCPAPVASAFAPPAPVSAAPQLRPFCRPHRFCLRLPASPVHRTKYGSVLCTLPFRIPARHPGNGPARHLFVRPSPLRLPALAAPQLRPFHRPRRSVPSSPSLTRTPDRARIRSMRTTVPHPRPAPRERSRPASFCPAPVASAFAPPAPVSAAPAVPPSPPLLPSSSSLSRTPDKVRVRTVRAAVPHPHPAPREWSRPGIFLPGSCRFSLRPSGPRFRRSPTPAVLPSSPLLPSSSSLSRTPDKVRVCTVHAAVPHPRPAPRERSRPTSFCPAFAPTAPGPCRSPAPTVPPSSPLRTFVSQPLPHAGQSSVPFCTRCRSASPPESRERSRPASFCPAPVAPPLPAATGRTGCSFGPAREKGCLTDLRQPRFYPYCYSGTSPNTQFSENWKNSSDGPLHSYSRSRTSPPPSEHAAQRIEKLAGQLRPLPNRAAGRPPSRPGSGKAQQFIAPQQWIT